MDHNFSFNSPAMGGQVPFGSASSRLTKPRFVKKKHTASNRPITFETDPSFNPFRSHPPEEKPGLGNTGPMGSTKTSVSGNTGVVFGSSKASIYGNPFSSTLSSDPLRLKANANFRGIIGPDKALVGDLRNLKIASDHQHINVSQNMNVNESSNKSEMRVTDQLLASKLTKEVENKLKIKSEEDTESSQKSEMVDGGVGGMKLLNGMNKLNIKEESTDRLKNPAYRRVELTSDENIVQTGLPAFTKTANELKSEIFSGKNSIFSGKVPADITFQAERSELSSTGDQSSSTSSCSSINFPPAAGSFEAPFMDKPGNKVEFSFSGLMQHVDCKTPTLKGSLNRKLETKRELTKDTKLKKKKGKHRKPVSIQMNVGQSYFPAESSQENVDSSESYSPMDISPYQETPADNSFSRENSVTSDEASSLNDKYASSESQPMHVNDIEDVDLIDATEQLSITGNSNSNFNEKEKSDPMPLHQGVCVEGPSEDTISGAETESFRSATDQFDCSTDSFLTAQDNEVSSSSTTERQDTIGGTHTNLEDTCQSSFIFAASSTAQSHSTSVPRHQKKKVPSKPGSDLNSSFSSAKVPHSSFSRNHFQVSGTYSLPLNRGNNVDIPVMLNQIQGKSEPAKENVVKQETRSAAAESMAAQEACEKWRLRGNQAYASGDLSRAEDCYTQGLNCISQNETSKSALQALMLCYSNRAATRMSLRRMTEALEDCLTAIKMDPNFFRAQIRAANCYLSLGEAENASQHFMRCLDIGNKSCAERKVLVEASEGLEKAKKVSECMKQSVTLLRSRMPDDVVGALAVIADALMISPWSEKLLEMKVDALFMLGNYEEVIKLCELTLSSAELKRFQSDVNLGMLDASKIQKTTSFRLWCCSMTVKAYFYLGKLEEAAVFLNREEKSLPLKQRGEDFTLESSIPLAATIRELLRFKASGNEAFQSGKHAEAIEHYSAAISCNVESRPFAAICFCNRAAAYRAVGQILDAIADCSLSIALDGNYVKAISRRASLLEMIRDFGQAASDLRRLIDLLTRQLENKINPSDKSLFVNELRQTEQKLLRMEDEDRKEIPLNMYLILGVDPSAASSEIKKAYRKAALKHHPDKAGQLVAKNDNTDHEIWRGIAEEVRRDADRLFKMIGEAYALLSDPAKRSRYDLEEEMRNTQSRGNRGGSTMNTQRDSSQNYPFEKSGSRWQRSDVWRAYGNSQPRESDRSHRSNWYS
ncbi:unnamed protein product [Cuscuta epithymum]|uniref:Uncharacterized protein n=1 Tax=Cuscuta epithymum TaxID=186058 RepID=A0AAV0FCY0_9ASTE|nr:unnamed protein product [Cuscuta epithymum]